MDKDLFGKKIKKTLTPAEMELKKYDAGSFQERLRRLNYINKILPSGSQIFGSDESSKIFDEAIQCYIFGQFVATIILSQSFIERRFQEYFHIRMDEVKSKATLYNLLEDFKKTGFIDDFFIQKINEIRLKRNPFVHHKEPLHKDSLMYRALHSNSDPSQLLQGDAKDAIALMIQMSKMRIL